MNAWLQRTTRNFKAILKSARNVQHLPRKILKVSHISNLSASCYCLIKPTLHVKHALLYRLVDGLDRATSCTGSDFFRSRKLKLWNDYALTLLELRLTHNASHVQDGKMLL